MEAPVHTRQEILERLRRLSAELREMGVERLGLFGSFSRDEARADSDVDILVEFAPGRKSFDSFMQLSFRLEDVLKRHVEVVTRESLSPYIGPRILAGTEYVSIDD
jgi:hypothetical protein